MESFRSGIENRNDKLKREISMIVQLLLKCLLDAMGSNQETKSKIIDTSAEDFYLINKITNIECTDLNYSEILRLYIKRAFTFLGRRRELTENRFNIDVTGELYKKLEFYLTSLNNFTFEFLQPEAKAGIMAYLCDELLSTSPIEDLNNLHNPELVELIEDNDQSSCVVYDLDEAIEEFHNLKQEVCQLDSKRRQLRTEKTTIMANLNNITAEQNPNEKDKQQKASNKLDKSLSQLEKKRSQFKKESDLMI